MRPLSHDSSLSITIDLDPGTLEGQNADWWIGVNTPWVAPADWYTFVHNGVTVNWEQGAALSFGSIDAKWQDSVEVNILP